MIKYLYVLVSDEIDYYLEQALMSITSLMIHTPDAFISLLIDDTTERTLKGNRGDVLGLVNELKVIEIPPQFNKKARSRWLKTSMRKYIENDFLYIDCDTIVSGSLTDTVNFTIDLGAVLDTHVPLIKSQFRKNIQSNDKALAFNASFVLDNFFNSGVIFCKDVPTCHSFFNEWHRLWLGGIGVGVLIDQPSFNQANLNLGATAITEIDGMWNCQISICGGINFLADAKIIHYFSTLLNHKNPFELANACIFQRIKKLGFLDKELQTFLLYPKRKFSLQTRLEVRRTREIFRDIFLHYFYALTKFFRTNKMIL